MKIADAFVEVSLKADKLITGMRRAEDSTRKAATKMGLAVQRAGRQMEQSFARVTRGVKGFLVALAAGFSIRAFIRQMSELRSELDAVAKQARTIGIDPEALSGFGFAAERTTKLSSQQAGIALERFVKRVGEASVGAGELGPVLTRLGLDARSLASMEPLAALEHFSDAISTASSRGVKLADIQKALGDEARGLLPLLEGGGVELRAQIADYRRLSGGYGDVLEKAENLGDEIGRMNVALKSLGEELISAFGPFIAGLADATSELAIYSRNLTKNNADILTGMAAWFRGDQNQMATSVGRLLTRQAAGGDRDTSRPPTGNGPGNEFVPRRPVAAPGGFNTQLGTFKLPGQTENVLKGIESSNRRLVELAERRSREQGAFE